MTNNVTTVLTERLNYVTITVIERFNDVTTVVLHALSSYKDHPYKDQVVHFRKNKDQY